MLKLLFLVNLPNPSSEFVKKLNSVIFKLIWDNGPDQIKIKQITNPYNRGGLKIININLFVKSLKITWIRRIIKSEINVPWLSLVNTIIPKFK